MTSTGKKCEALTKAGTPCAAWAVEGSDFCFWHDPAQAKARAAARAKGGRARHGRHIGQTGTTEPVEIGNMADVVALLQRTINDALSLENSLQRARTIGRSLPARFALAGMPLGLSTFLSRGYRRLSARAVARKSRWEKAVDFAKVRSHLLSGHDAVVCGHVHRAARYRVHLPDRRDGEFITLGDWRRRGVYLVAREDSLALRTFS